MPVTMVHIYHQDNSPGDIGVQVNMPLNDMRYCIKILQTMDKVRADVVKILAQRNQDDIKRKKSMYEHIKGMFKSSISEQEKKKINDDIKKMQAAEVVGAGIQNALNHLTRALSNANLEEKQRIIKDINASIKNIAGGA